MSAFNLMAGLSGDSLDLFPAFAGNMPHPQSNILAGFSKASESGVGIRSSVADAKKIIDELGCLLQPEMPAKVKQPAIHRALLRFIPSITERRVRALANGEARVIDHYEMLRLKEALFFERAIHAKRELRRTATRIATFLAIQGAPLDCHQADALGKLVGEEDRAGDFL